MKIVFLFYETKVSNTGTAQKTKKHCIKYILSKKEGFPNAKNTYVT